MKRLLPRFMLYLASAESKHREIPDSAFSFTSVLHTRVEQSSISHEIFVSLAFLPLYQITRSSPECSGAAVPLPLRDCTPSEECTLRCFPHSVVHSSVVVAVCAS